MAAEQKNQTFTTQLIDWAKTGNLAQLEEAWIEQMQSLPNQGAFYKEWIKAMRKAAAAEKAEELMLLVLENRIEARKFKPALRILLAALPSFPKSELLRPALLSILRGFYTDQEMLEDLIRLTD